MGAGRLVLSESSQPPDSTSRAGDGLLMPQLC